MSKAIITAAITGAIHTPSMSPYLPVTPEQIIDECVASHGAGAAIAHVHVRDPLTGCPTSDQDLFRYIATEVKKNATLFCAVLQAVDLACL